MHFIHPLNCFRFGNGWCLLIGTRKFCAYHHSVPISIFTPNSWLMPFLQLPHVPFWNRCILYDTTSYFHFGKSHDYPSHSIPRKHAGSFVPAAL